ncbi:MAG TPA: recombinase family protein [Demequina sp.]|nr:recombinase family protein [Demequina sp.]
MPSEGGLTGDTLGVGERIGYAQVPIEAHDPTTHRNALVALGVEPDRVYVDEGQSATNRARPGLREAMAARQAGDTLVGARPDRLARARARERIAAARGKAGFEQRVENLNFSP